MNPNKIQMMEQHIIVLQKEVQSLHQILKETHKEIGELVSEMQQVISLQTVASRTALGVLSDRLDNLELNGKEG